MDDDSSVLWEAVKLPLKVLGYGLRGLDLPRQALWTLTEQVSGHLGRALGLRADPVPSWGNSWDHYKEGKGILELYDPDWVRENENTAWWYGLGLEIAGDPINLLSGPGAMTKVGQGLKMGTAQGLQVAADAGSTGARRALEIIGKRATSLADTERLASKYSRMLLGVDWATQAKHGQRALVSMFRTPLVNAPKAVARIAKTGRAIGKAMSWVGETVFRTDFFTKTFDPKLRRVLEIAQDKAADVHTKLLKIQDEAASAFVNIDPDVMEQVTKAAEHYARPGWHMDEFAKFAPDVQEMARKYHDLSDEFWSQATKLTGIERPKLGYKLEQTIRKLQSARGAQMQEVLNRAMPMFDEMKQNGLRRLGDQFETATKAWAQAREAAETAYDAMGTAYTPRAERTFQRLASEATEKAKKMEDLIDEARKLGAMGFDETQIPEHLMKPIRDLDAKIAGLRKAQDDLPNYVMRHLTPEGRVAVRRFASGKGTNRLWTDQFQGQMERTIAEHLTSLGVKDAKRALGYEEIQRLFQDALGKPGETAARRYAEASVPFMDWIKWKVFDGKTPTVDLKRFYDVDIARNFERMTKQVVNAFESQEFIKMLTSNTDLVSKVAKEGWFRVSDVSEFAAKALGRDTWVSPALFAELRRTYTSAFQPESLNRVVRAWDYVTKLFKTSVTVPESFLPHVGGATLGAVVGGAATGDVWGALGGAAVGFGASHALKESWLPAFPAYHFRNNMSDFILMSYNGAFSPHTVAVEGMKAAARSKGKVWCGKALGELPYEHVSRLARAHGITMGEVKAFAQSRIGSYLEDSRRMGYFIDRLRRGFSPFQAALETKRVLFNYGELSGLERGLMKRVIPFWSWTRNIVKLSATQMMRSPAIMKHQLRLAAPMVSREDVPSWIKGRLPIALSPDKQTGEERFLTGIGLPVEDLADLLDDQGGFKDWIMQWSFKVNPTLKAALGFPALSSEEAGRGFWDKFLGLRDYPQKIGEIGKYVPEALHEKFGIRKKTVKGKETWTIDPHWDFVFRSIANRFYSTATKYADPTKDTGWKMIDYLTGARIDTFDKAQAQKRANWRRRDALVAKARRRGDPIPGR